MSIHASRQFFGACIDPVEHSHLFFERLPMSLAIKFAKGAAYCFFPIGTAAMLSSRSKAKAVGDFHQDHPKTYFALTFIWWLLVIATAGLFAVLWYAIEWCITPKKGKRNDFTDEEIDIDGVRFEPTYIEEPTESERRADSIAASQRETLASILDACALRRPTEIRTEISRARIRQEALLCVGQMRDAINYGVDLHQAADRIERLMDDLEVFPPEYVRHLLSGVESKLSVFQAQPKLESVRRSVQTLNASICYTYMSGLVEEPTEMQIIPGFMLATSRGQQNSFSTRMTAAYRKFLFEWQLQALNEEGFLFSYDSDDVPCATDAHGEVCHRFYEAAAEDSPLRAAFASHLSIADPFI